MISLKSGWWMRIQKFLLSNVNKNIFFMIKPLSNNYFFVCSFSTSHLLVKKWDTGVKTAELELRRKYKFLCFEFIKYFCWNFAGNWGNQSRKKSLRNCHLCNWIGNRLIIRHNNRNRVIISCFIQLVRAHTLKLASLVFIDITLRELLFQGCQLKDRVNSCN